MKSPRVALLMAFAAASSVGLAQTLPSVSTAEPEVRSGVIEDEGSKIEELRVRGQAQRIVVSPKVGPRGRYEITRAASSDIVLNVRANFTARHRLALGVEDRDADFVPV